MENNIDENLLTDGFKNAQEFAREWRQFNAIDTEAGWRKIQKKVRSLRRLNFDGTFTEPSPGALSRLLGWLYEPRYRLTTFTWVLNSLLGLYVLCSYLWFGDRGLASGLGYVKTYLERSEGAPPIPLADHPAGYVINDGRVDIQLEKRDLLLRSRDAPSYQPDSQLTLHTARGGRCSMIMTDGSKVHLNAASYIRFATYYGVQRREVNLNGEGYFEVKPLAMAAGRRHKSPFVVHVGSLLTVTATGTTFNIKAYDTDSSIRATLVEGTLEIQHPGDSTVRLSSGDSYILNRDGSFEVHSSDQRGAVSWKEGEFRFEDRPLDEILQELCRFYDAKVEYKCTPVGLFSLIGSRDEPIEKVLKRIDGAGNIHIAYQDKDRTIIVTMSHSS